MSRPPARRVGRVIQAVWIAGFLVGTTTHVIDLILGGSATYGEFPVGLRAFWISLTVLDPLTVVLLLLRKRAAVMLGVAIILADIAVNWSVFFTTDRLAVFGVVNQTLFAVVLLITARPLWRWMPRPARAEGA